MVTTFTATAFECKTTRDRAFNSVFCTKVKVKIWPLRGHLPINMTTVTVMTVTMMIGRLRETAGSIWTATRGSQEDTPLASPPPAYKQTCDKHQTLISIHGGVEQVSALMPKLGLRKMKLCLDDVLYDSTRYRSISKAWLLLQMRIISEQSTFDKGVVVTRSAAVIHAS